MAINKKEAFILALHFMSMEEQEALWEYIALTDYGTRSISVDRQVSLQTLLRQFMKQEHLDMLDIPSRLQLWKQIKNRPLHEQGPFLELFPERS